MLKLLKIVGNIVILALAFILPIVVLAAVGYYSNFSLTRPEPADLIIPPTGPGSQPTKSFDPAKPTVAIVLGSDRTEGTDFLIPYQIFSASAAYNVYAVAPERKATSLAGGLEVMPDFSYTELNTLLGKSPDVVVIPAIPDPESAENKPVLTWIKQQSDHGSYVISICVGAEAFAATGLLDGHTATTHWGDIDRIEALYPAVNWVRGVRYVDGGNYLTSAGITSGIDAVLHYIAQHNGDDVARAISQKMNYPSYGFVDNPQVQQYSTGADLTTIGLINILFHLDHPTAGVLLYDGINELELAATYDTYVATNTTKLLSVSQTRRLITTQYGLQVVPRWSFSDVAAMERLIVPGSQARQLAAADVGAWQSRGKAAPVFYLHADQPQLFAFDAPLQDLARQENIPTAVLDAMRLEYRPGTIQTEGSTWPLWLTIRPLLLGLAGLAIAVFISMRWRRPSVPQVGGITVPAQV
jgi:AraC family transcriptional regulator, transcriptional activator FtrA